MENAQPPPSCASAGRAREDAADGVERTWAAETFSHAVSLGSLCVTASWLQGQGLRTGSGPFDWVHSSPAMVRHCLRDDFRMYLDRSQYFVSGQTIGHMTYSDMQLGKHRKTVWLHHDPLQMEDDHALLSRCVDRLRNVLRDCNGERKLFLLCVLVKSARALEAFRADRPPKLPESGAETVPVVPKIPLARTDSFGADKPWAFGNRAEMRGLFHDLCEMGVRTFHLDVVYLCSGTASVAQGRGKPDPQLVVTEPSNGNEGALRAGGSIGSCAAVGERASLSPARKPDGGGESLAIHELHLVGGHTGLRFKESIDECAFTELLLRRRGDYRTRVASGDSLVSNPSVKASGDPDVGPRRFELRPVAPALDNKIHRASRYGDDVDKSKPTRRARGGRQVRVAAFPVPSSRRRSTVGTSRMSLWRKAKAPRPDSATVDRGRDDASGDASKRGGGDAAPPAGAPKRLRISGPGPAQDEVGSSRREVSPATAAAASVAAAAGDDDLERGLAESLNEFKASERRLRQEAQRATLGLMLAELEAMGFSRSDAESALRRADGDQMQAIEFLVSA